MPDTPPLPIQSDRPIWQFTFARQSQADEEKFRQQYLDADIKQVLTITLILMVLMIVMSLADIPQLANISGLGFGIVLRMTLVFSGALLVWTILRWRSARTLDIGVASFAMISAICIVIFHMTSDVSAARIGTIGTLYIFVAHITFPVYSLYLLPAVLLFMAGETMVLFNPSRDVLPENRQIIVITFLFAELMSLYASAHLQRTRFLAFRALMEVKNLSGIIPICSNCRKVRDDSGYYQQLERYISSHSDAQFSHGVCPDCIDKLYPEVALKRRKE